MKAEAKQGGHSRIHVHHTTGSNEDRAARMYIGAYYRHHISSRRKDFLQFIAKTKQPLTRYEAFIVLMDNRMIYHHSLKALYGFAWRGRYYRPTIIRLWKDENGINFVCAPDCSLFHNVQGEDLSDERGKVKPEVKEAGMNYIKAKLMME